MVWPMLDHDDVGIGNRVVLNGPYVRHQLNQEADAFEVSDQSIFMMKSMVLGFEW